MVLNATIEEEFNIDDFLSVYEVNTGEAILPSDFEDFYNYWLKAFEIFSYDIKAACWKQNKYLIKQEFELLTT